MGIIMNPRLLLTLRKRATGINLEICAWICEACNSLLALVIVFAALPVLASTRFCEFIPIMMGTSVRLPSISNLQQSAVIDVVYKA